MLVKDEGGRKSKVPTPNKLEEELLRQRFPAQHRAVIRAIKKMQVNSGDDSDQITWRYSGEFPTEHSEEEEHANESIPAPTPDFSVSLHSKPTPNSSHEPHLKASGVSVAAKRTVPSTSSRTHPPLSGFHRKSSHLSSSSSLRA